MAIELSGKAAEFLALNYLRCHGYHLVEKNYITGRGTGAGEVDIIVTKGSVLVFVEVKKRHDLATAAYSILPKQQQRIRRAAENFAATHPQYAAFDIRFDAVLIQSPITIQHIPNAF
jgi:putative endonuclease